MQGAAEGITFTERPSLIARLSFTDGEIFHGVCSGFYSFFEENTELNAITC